MPQCPPFNLTFLSDDVFNTDLVDGNSCVHYVLRTPSANDSGGSPGKRFASGITRTRPSLARKSPARNPTIIVRPKSSSSEAKIVASLQWHHWADSIFSTRWQVVRLDKMLPVRDDNNAPHAINWAREVSTTKGIWHWCNRTEGGLKLLDASDKVIARFDDYHSISDPSDQPSSLPQLCVEFKALDLLDLIVTSLLVVVHERQQHEPIYSSRDSADSSDDGISSFEREPNVEERPRR